MTESTHVGRPFLLVERVRNEVARRAFQAMLVVGGDRPVSASAVGVLTRIAGSANALSDWFGGRPVARTELANSRVRAALGFWPNASFAIGADALNFLDAGVRRMRPDAVLEFGSGHSTVLLAAAMADLHGSDGSPHLFSIDESEEYLDMTERLLAKAGLTRRVKLAHRPLREQTIGGRLSRCYELDDDFLDGFLEARPDLVLIDGPSGGGEARLGTLPLVSHRLARPCTFFLDDALRTDEVQVASRWRDVPGITLHGVYPVGSGLLEGSLVGR